MAANGGLRSKNRAGLQYVSFQSQEVIWILPWSIFSSVETARMPQHTFPSAFLSATADTFSFLFHSLWLLFPSSLLFYFCPFLFFHQCLYYPPIQTSMTMCTRSISFLITTLPIPLQPVWLDKRSSERNCLFLYVCSKCGIIMYFFSQQQLNKNKEQQPFQTSYISACPVVLLCIYFVLKLFRMFIAKNSSEPSPD